MNITFKIDGVQGVEDSCKYVKNAVAGALEVIAYAGAFPIQTEAQILSPKLTGTNARSIHTEVVNKSSLRCTVLVGPHTPYARRLEYGFMQRDRLGRMYHQAAQPYMRPAYDTKKQESLDEMRAVARDEIREALIEAANASGARRNKRVG